MIQLERGILVEDSFKGVTIGALVFPHGTIMIDAPLKVKDGRVWHSVLLNQRRGSNRLLVLLDAHPDRTLGSRTMECTILAHQNAAEVFRSRPMIFKGTNIESGAVWETYNEAIGMRWAIPDLTFSDRMVLHWGGPEVILEYHPGSSKGAIWLIIPEFKIMFVGDSAVVDQPVFLADANLDTWIDELLILKKSYKDFRIVSGRSGIVDVDAINSQIINLRKIRSGLERLAKRDAAPEATQKMVNPLLKGLDFPNEWYDLYKQRLRYGLYQQYNHRYSRSGGKVGSYEIGH